MSNLEDTVAATKILGEESETLIGGASSKQEENGVGFLDAKGNDDGSSAAEVGGEPVLENKATLEPTHHIDDGLDCSPVDQGKHGAENLSSVSNGGASLSVNGDQVGANGSSEGVGTEKKLKDTEDSCVVDASGPDNHEEVDNVENEDANVPEVDEGVGNGQLTSEDHVFRVGDFVWGKIKSHPWWPGQVYDPKDASEFALKHHQEGRLLVAFFGDGSCSWCLPSQLIPFVPNFTEMSADSSSKSFVNAVQKAVNEFGRLLEAQMTCKCIPVERKDGLARPVVRNAGVKPGVLMPEVDLRGLSVPEYEPPKLLSALNHFAKNVHGGNVLELAVLRSSLSAFNRYKGGYQLHLYHEPVYVEGLEDKSRSATTDENDSTVPIEAPLLGPRDDDWISSPLAGAAKQLGSSGDKIYHRRKQKSVAELMAENATVPPKSHSKEKGKRGTDIGSSETSQKMKDRRDGQPEREGGQRPGSSGKKRKSKVTESPQTKTETGNLGDPDGPSLGKPKGIEIATAASEKASRDAKDEIDSVSSPRERKKSKYLSPPYTDVPFRVVIPSSKIKMELGTESDKITKRVGARGTKDAGEILESSPDLGSVDKTSEENLPLSQLKREASVKTNGLSIKDENLSFPPSDVNMPVDELLSNVQSAATNHICSSKEGTLDAVWAFISAFRSSTYAEGSSYRVFQKCKIGRKRKSLSSELGKREKDIVDSKKDKLVGLESLKLMRSEGNLNRPKSRKSSKSVSSSDGDKVEGKTPPCLVLTFSPDFPLPSKGEIISLFQKFGPLNEKESCVSEESHLARVVFVYDFTAEKAFKSSLSQSPFGIGNVNYKLQHASSGSKSRDSRPKVSKSAKDAPNKPESSHPADDLMSDARAVTQKVEIMTAILENYHTKFSSEDKSSLRDEMKGLLEKIESTSERVRVLAEETSLYRN